MPKKGKLRGAWADLLPQESTKRQVIPHEKTPWGCRYCKSPLLRFSSPANLHMHVSKMHPLLFSGLALELGRMTTYYEELCFRSTSS